MAPDANQQRSRGGSFAPQTIPRPAATHQDTRTEVARGYSEIHPFTVKRLNRKACDGQRTSATSWYRSLGKRINEFGGGRNSKAIGPHLSPSVSLIVSNNNSSPPSNRLGSSKK